MKKYIGLISVIMASAALFVAISVKAESTVVTSQGTFRCESACVVDGNGNVTDKMGGNVWKLMEE